MKKITLICSLLTMMVTLSNCTAQSGKTVKQELTKEVNVTDENGVKTVTIKTTEDGKTTTESFTGKEAEAKLKELESGEQVMETELVVEAGPDDVVKTINMEDINGVKTLTVSTTIGGKTTTETYAGEEADKKLKELENEQPKTEKGKTVKQTIRVKEVKEKE